MPEIREAVIVEAVRTPIGKRDGSLKGIHPVDLLAEVLKEAVNRWGADQGQIEDNIEGCGYEGKLVPQSISADLIATKWDISREESDDFGYRSHVRAGRATREGYLKREILPLKVAGPNGEQVLLDRDEGIRMEPDRERMRTLQPAFKSEGFEQMFPGQLRWTVTAGNSSQIS